jgi:hypothetical protein
MNIAPKTAGAAAAGSVSVAFVEILAWILGYWNIVIPPGVGASLATVFAVIASYFSPRQHFPSDPVPVATEALPSIAEGGDTAHSDRETTL